MKGHKEESLLRTTSLNILGALRSEKRLGLMAGQNEMAIMEAFMYYRSRKIKCVQELGLSLFSIRGKNEMMGINYAESVSISDSLSFYRRHLRANRDLVQRSATSIGAKPYRRNEEMIH